MGVPRNGPEKHARRKVEYYQQMTLCEQKQEKLEQIACEVHERSGSSSESWPHRDWKGGRGWEKVGGMRGRDGRGLGVCDVKQPSLLLTKLVGAG